MGKQHFAWFVIVSTLHVQLVNSFLPVHSPTFITTNTSPKKSPVMQQVSITPYRRANVGYGMSRVWSDKSSSSNSGDTDDEPERLPASYRSDNGTRDSEFNITPLSSSLNSTVPSSLSTTVSPSTNHYVSVVSSLTPSDLISRFLSTTPPSVQEAVRTTILGLIGSLPKLGWESTTVATGERLAALMFQLQMTGYMFKNAEYRMSLSKSLSNTKSLPGDSSPSSSPDPPVVSGMIKVTVAPGMDVEVEAEAYMSELREEVTKLKTQLDSARSAKEDKKRKDMLAYIRSLPEDNMKELTGTITPDVLDAMKLLVDTVLSEISSDNIGPDTVTEQSGTAMAQLCMWQLVQGYNLRELEVREEMEKRMKGELEGGE